MQKNENDLIVKNREKKNNENDLIVKNREKKNNMYKFLF